MIARDLYLRAVEEDPQYASAWVRLGRCHWLVGKSTGEDKEAHIAKAEACFETCSRAQSGASLGA